MPPNFFQSIEGEMSRIRIAVPRADRIRGRHGAALSRARSLREGGAIIRGRASATFL